MARDIEPIAPGDARAAARLCNIPTGTTTLLPAHTDWLDKVGKEIVATSPNPWIDLFGYASHLGNPLSNKKLSNARCERVMNYIGDYNVRARFPQEFGFGDSKSTGGPKNDDGYWRAVEVYVYGAMPPGKKPRVPIVLPVPKEWFVTAFSGQTFSLVIAAGFTSITGHITFEKPNGFKSTRAIALMGGSVGLSYVPKGVGGALQKLLGSRFPALARLMSSGGDAFAKWLSGSGSIIGKLVVNSPQLKRAVTLLKAVAGGASTGEEAWWSPAIGIVYGSRGREVQTSDFAGSCLCYAVTGTIAIMGFGTYVLFFGLDPSFSPWDDPGALINLMALEGKSKGVAVIAASSVAAQMPGLGAGATIFWGEIV